MSDMRSLIEKLTAISEDRPTIGDGVYLEFSNILQVDTEIMEMDCESITLLGDEKLLGLLESLNEIENRKIDESPISNIAMPGDTPQQAAIRKAIVAGLNQDYVQWSNIVNDIANITADGTVQLTPNSGQFAKYMNNILAKGGIPGAKVEVLKHDWEKRADAKLAQEIKNWKSWKYRLGVWLKNPIGYENEKNDAYLRTGGQVESIGEAKLWRARDFGGNNRVNHYRDDYFIATSTHEDEDVRKVDYHLLKKVVKTDDEMTPAYEEITVLNVNPYRASREEINQAADKAIAQKGSVSEGEVVSMQDNHQTLKRLAKMWWHGDEGKHAQAVKMLSNMGWDIDEDDDDIVLNKGDKEVRFFMDDLYESLVAEAEYHGRKVPLGKPMRGDVKKFKVFVKDPKTGNVKKVNFGDKKMRIKKSNPKRRKSFRARHNCANPGPRTKARYWSCRKW